MPRVLVGDPFRRHDAGIFFVILEARVFAQAPKKLVIRFWPPMKAASRSIISSRCAFSGLPVPDLLNSIIVFTLNTMTMT